MQRRFQKAESTRPPEYHITIQTISLGPWLCQSIAIGCIVSVDSQNGFVTERQHSIIEG